MIKDLKKYAEQNWKNEELFKSISEISKSEKQVSLVHSDTKIYSFDGIVKSIFQNQDCPTSADGLFFTDKCLNLIEFKSGFKQKITRDKFDITKCRCPHYPQKSQVENCSDYGKILLENQELKFSELLDSLKLKAVESYILLKQLIFNAKIEFENICLCIVIDSNALESQEFAFGELAGKFSQNNEICKVQSALSRFSSEKYKLYKTIKVYSVNHFEKKCESIIK